MTNINIGLLGCGNVGRGVYKILTSSDNRHSLLKKINSPKVAVRDLTRTAIERGVDIPAENLTINSQLIVADDTIEIVVEVIGGITDAYKLILTAIENKKHVVTANKTLIATHGIEILNLANKYGVCVLYEAAVAGGIPIIHALKHSLGANRLESVTGIINGTTNYILTQMTELGWSYEKALEEAQNSGYAEADPRSDVEGKDAAQKMVIIARLAFNKNINLEEVENNSDFTFGITSINQQDIKYAKKLGYTIKLLATTKIKLDNSLFFCVSPHFVHNEHPLASVKGAKNAIFVEGDPVGQLMFYGDGAGEGATASAVVSDILNIMEDISSGVAIHQLSKSETVNISPSKDMMGEFYLRLLTENIPTAFGGVMWLLSQASVNPKLVERDITTDGLLEIVMLTEPISRQVLNNALTIISGLPHFKKVANVLPLFK